MLFESLGTAHPHLKSGKVRALAVTGTARNASLPDVPTLDEAGVPGYASVPWYTSSAARGVPPAIVSKLNAEINAALKTPELVQRWDALGIQPLGGSVADAVRRNQMETDKWTAVITSANLKAE